MSNPLRVVVCQQRFLFQVFPIPSTNEADRTGAWAAEMASAKGCSFLLKFQIPVVYCAHIQQGGWHEQT